MMRSQRDGAEARRTLTQRPAHYHIHSVQQISSADRTHLMSTVVDTRMLRSVQTKGRNGAARKSGESDPRAAAGAWYTPRGRPALFCTRTVLPSLFRDAKGCRPKLFLAWSVSQEERKMVRPRPAGPAVIHHPLSSLSLPSRCAELISQLTQRLSAVESAVALMQRRADMETRCQCDLGPKTSLLCNLVRSCLIGSPIGIREYIRIVRPRQPDPAVNPLTGSPPDFIEVALLAYVQLDSAKQAPGPTRTVTTSSVPDSPPDDLPDDPRIDVGASEPRSESTAAKRTLPPC
ncbi:hypothetical protein FA95DRAFT_514970 [Auriscalpium vulgare]|uniref:Uncharacterized protein n=1 Tax=Auriscalpium vulgare TaxID=40419 RepID=A0ACB8RG11_9AGAM|nr:hypothetical protein FA95DRAFT_514970 [Auriscalpium vulgare]